MNKPNKHNVKQKGTGKPACTDFIYKGYKINHNRFIVLGVRMMALLG